MEKYLRRCLDSLIIDEEGMKQLEVLVINDGSKDSSSQIAHEYQDKYPDTYRVIDKENGNYGSCINRGLKEATGKYVKVLDSDDTYDNHSLVEYLQTLNTIDVDIIVTNVSICNKDGKITNKWRKDYPVRKIIGIDNMSDLWIHNTTYSRRVFDGLNYHQTEGISYTDEEFVYFPLRNALNFYYLPVDLYCYYLGRDGQTMNIDVWKRNFTQEIIVSKNLLQYWKDNYNKCWPSKNAMENKLVAHINHFFHRVLLEFSMSDNEEVVKFDKLLLEMTPDIYKKTGETAIADPRLRFKYLEHWRENFYSLSESNSYFQLYKLISSIREKKLTLKQNIKNRLGGGNQEVLINMYPSFEERRAA